MTDGFSLLGMKKVDRRMEVLEGRDSAFLFLGLSGRSVLVEFGGFPSVSRKAPTFSRTSPMFFQKTIRMASRQHSVISTKQLK